MKLIDNSNPSCSKCDNVSIGSIWDYRQEKIVDYCEVCFIDYLEYLITEYKKINKI